MPEAEDRAEAERLRYEIEELIATGRALSSVRDTRQLLSLILRKCREVTGADAGSVYVLEGEGTPGEKRLHFMLSQNDSLQIDFQEFTLAVDERSIVGKAVLAAKPLNIADLEPRKLYDEELRAIEARIAYVRKSQQVELLQHKLDLCEQLGVPEAAARYGELDAELARKRAELDGILAFVITTNEPTVMEQGGFERLLEIGQLRYLAPSGEPRPVLEPAEIAALQVRRGSLTDVERIEIESHVVHTHNFLKRIPWGRTLRDIPRIAGAHHEYLNGDGYPRGLANGQIPIESRMMTIADIFDALTASDRPYKRAVPIDRALAIIESEVKAGKVDGLLFEIFVKSETYKVVL